MSWELFPLFLSSERDCRELYNTFSHYMFERIFFLATLHSLKNLRPWPRIECMPHAVEAQSLTIGTPVRPPDSSSLIDADLFRLSIVWDLVDCLSGNWSLASRRCKMEKEMATHSSILAWRIPGMGEPSGLQSMGSHRVGHDWSDLAAA